MALRRPRVRISLGPHKNGSSMSSVREPGIKVKIRQVLRNTSGTELARRTGNRYAAAVNYSAGGGYARYSAQSGPDFRASRVVPRRKFLRP
jgi:hypothetical protein